ncbi:hypothetical protein ACTXT7_015699 [Hymenolepis weldensis]
MFIIYVPDKPTRPRITHSGSRYRFLIKVLLRKVIWTRKEFLLENERKRAKMNSRENLGDKFSYDFAAILLSLLMPISLQVPMMQNPCHVKTRLSISLFL